MADSGKQSPLGVNVLGSLLANAGFVINPVAQSYMGISRTNAGYAFGSILNNTVLHLLTWAINDGYVRGWFPGTTLTTTTYNNLISIGADTIPALGNSMPPTYTVTDPAGVWTNAAQAYGLQTTGSAVLPGPATSGYGNYSNSIGDPLEGYGVVDQQQNATWYPYNTTNPNNSITQWGYIRLHALQAWNEFNWNGTTVNTTTPEYKEFCASFSSAVSAAGTSNQTISTVVNSNTLLDGTYSNMDDLMSADISGVNLSTKDFGTDLENLGKAIDLKQIETFGLPSNLLRTIGKNSAVTQDLSLALLAAGLTTKEISDITGGVTPNVSKALEQKIYGAFLIITGENLAHVLAPLQCVTQGLNSLADLLNLKMLFPISYSALTVPIYNAIAGPTNSKTYYLIYQNGGVNDALDTPALQEYVGTIIPSGKPPIFDKASNPENYTELPKGFASYLQDIIPYDQALAAGAFSYTMRQIRNIQNVDIQKFAKVVKGIENTSNLNLVNGTSKPTDQTQIDFATSVQALGSGPSGSLTLSDFFGCMSGLPYPWQLIEQRIQEAQTDNLAAIYRGLFLAVTWDPAIVTVQYTTYTAGPPGPPTTYYHVTGVTLTHPGGGYIRGDAPVPTITLSNGGTAVATVEPGEFAPSVDHVNTGYGRVTSVTLTSSGPDSTSIPTVTIECPPTSTSGGTNTPAGTTGWPNPMNAVVQGYIDQANAEIASILVNKPDAAQHLNAYWNILGTQLAREQRTRYTYAPPVSVPKDFFLNAYPSTQSSFVDSLPQMALDTRPHMAAQTLEAISDLSTVGGQSLVALLRQERNQARLQQVGIDLDNNIADVLPNQIALTTNGTTSNAVNGIPSCGTEYTFPAWPSNIDDTGNTITPKPAGIYTSSEGFQQISGSAPGDITQILNCNPNPVAGTVVPAGPVVTPPSSEIVIIAPAPAYDPNNLPPNLDPNYTSTTLLPATPSIPDAIAQVTACNCDCWVK
jgi:hypothetical protein